MGQPSNGRLGETGGVEGVLGLVRSAGGRVTSPRRALVEALFAHDGHATAEELVELVRAVDPDAHLSTIYRNLEELEALGVVSHSHLGHGAATYQLESRSHAHFLCSSCGRTIDAPEGLFEDLAQRVHGAIGFHVDPSHFAVEGVCAECAAGPRDVTAEGP